MATNIDNPEEDINAFPSRAELTATTVSARVSTRFDLLNSIEGGASLKRVEINDRSAPKLGNSFTPLIDHKLLTQMVLGLSLFVIKLAKRKRQQTTINCPSNPLHPLLRFYTHKSLPQKVIMKEMIEFVSEISERVGIRNDLAIITNSNSKLTLLSNRKRKD